MQPRWLAWSAVFQYNRTADWQWNGLVGIHTSVELQWDHHNTMGQTYRDSDQCLYDPMPIHCCISYIGCQFRGGSHTSWQFCCTEFRARLLRVTCATESRNMFAAECYTHHCSSTIHHDTLFQTCFLVFNTISLELAIIRRHRQQEISPIGVCVTVSGSVYLFITFMHSAQMAEDINLVSFRIRQPHIFPRSR